MTVRVGQIVAAVTEETRPDPPRPAPDGKRVRLLELVDRLHLAANGRYRVEADGESLVEDKCTIVSGWSLTGGPDPAARRAAADLLASLLRAEDEIRSLSSEILERYEEATLIYRLSDRLGSVLGERGLADVVLQDAARVLGASRGEVWLCGDTGVWLGASVPDGCEPLGAPDDTVLAVLRSGRSWSREADTEGGPVLVVALPGADERPIGAIVLRGGIGRRAYRSGEVKLLTALAALTSAFVSNDRLSEQARRDEARRREDEIARQIHRGLLPADEPQVRGLEIAGACRAAAHIGGDYYGYMRLPDDGLGLAIADVSGHGVGAALYMAAAKGTLHAEARRTLSPADLLRRTNESLIADFSRSDVFATAFFARFHPGGRRFDFANGGHNPAVLVRGDGTRELLDCGGAALGMLPDLRYAESSHAFDIGDVLIVYTDGLVEARDSERAFYGLPRLVDRACEWRDAPAAQIRDRLFADLVEHCGAGAPHDDVTIVVVRGIGAGAAELSR